MRTWDGIEAAREHPVGIEVTLHPQLLHHRAGEAFEAPRVGTIVGRHAVRGNTRSAGRSSRREVRGAPVTGNDLNRDAGILGIRRPRPSYPSR